MYTLADAPTVELGLGALGLSRGASDREEDQMPSGPVYGARYGDVDLFSPSAAGPGGGTGS